MAAHQPFNAARGCTDGPPPAGQHASSVTRIVPDGAPEGGGHLAGELGSLSSERSVRDRANRSSRSATRRAWADDYNTVRPHSLVGYTTPAAFAAKIEKQRPGHVQAVASGALVHHNNRQSLVPAE